MGARRRTLLVFLALLLGTAPALAAAPSTVAACVATAEADPGTFTPQFEQCLLTLSTAAKEQGLAFEHERPEVTAMVVFAVRSELSFPRPEEVSVERAAQMLQRAGAEEWKPLRENLIRALSRSPVGKEALEARVKATSDDVAYIAASELMMKERQRAIPEARALVWKRYEVEPYSKSRDLPSAGGVVENNCESYRDALRAAIVGDVQIGRVRQWLFANYGTCAGVIGWHDLLTWSSDPHPEIAASAASVLELRLMNARLATWDASFRERDDPLWRAFLMRRRRFGTLTSYMGGATEEQVKTLVTWAVDPNPTTRRDVLHPLSVVGDEWASARAAVQRALDSKDVKDASAAAEAMVYSRNARWVDAALLTWLGKLGRERLADVTWGAIVLRVGDHFEAKHGRSFGFRAPEPPGRCGNGLWEDPAWQQERDLAAFGRKPPVKAPQPTPPSPRPPPSADEQKARQRQQADRYEQAVKALAEFTAGR